MIQRILQNPRENAMLIALVGIAALIFILFCVSGLLSLRASTRRRRFWLALGPLLFGVLGAATRMPVHVSSEGRHYNYELRWIFLLPLALGVAGILKWRSMPKAAPPPAENG